MSMRVDSTPLISSSLIVGVAGLGVLAENIPSTGTNGPGYVYDSLDLPADNGKEIIGRIVTTPVLGDFFAYEDTSFEFLNAPDGAHTFTFDVYEDGVFVPPTSTATITIGGAAVIVAATLGTTSLSAFDATIISGAPTVVNATLGASSITAFDATITYSAGVTVNAYLATSSIAAYPATITYSVPVIVSASLGTTTLQAFNATISTGEFSPIKSGRNVLVSKQDRMVTVL